MTSVAAPGEAAAAPRTWLDRVLAAVPLLSVFLWLCMLYAWQVHNHSTPWLFTDELELSQLSRAIAATGHAARRGEPHSFDTLYAYVIAPAWRLASIGNAYAVVKYIGVFTMTSVVFPTYFLARMIASKPAALFAAAAAGAIPALAFAPLIVSEPLAYPYAALCFLLIAKAIATRSRWWIAGAVVASLLAPLVRGQLAVISAVFVLPSRSCSGPASAGNAGVRAGRPGTGWVRSCSWSARSCSSAPSPAGVPTHGPSPAATTAGG